MPSRPLHVVRRWALYYGACRPPGLSRYDLVVVDRAGWDAPSLKTLRASGTRVAAYLSVLEVRKRSGEPPPSNVLYVQQQPQEQSEWQTWILDPRHPSTRTHLLDEATATAKEGYDGFFLDTAGDVESTSLSPDLRAELLPATASLIADLRIRFPSLYLIQNWGFGPLLNLTTPYLDALCWENFPITAPTPWQRQLARRLQSVRRQGVQVFALSLSHQETPPAWAEKLGFPWYGAPGSYTEFKL